MTNCYNAIIAILIDEQRSDNKRMQSGQTITVRNPISANMLSFRERQWKARPIVKLLNVFCSPVLRYQAKGSLHLPLLPKLVRRNRKPGVIARVAAK
jgi:hypothetical protein